MSKPTIQITGDAPSPLRNGDVVEVRFDLSELSRNFVQSAITVEGGTLDAFTGGGKSYSAKFTPMADSMASAVIHVAAGQFTNAAGDGNEASNTVRWTVDTTAPVITISYIPNRGFDRSSNPRAPLASGDVAMVTFTLYSENPLHPWDGRGVVVEGGGALGSITAEPGKPGIYTAVFTPKDNSDTDAVIRVEAGSFTSRWTAAGNNDASVTIPVDTTTRSDVAEAEKAAEIARGKIKAKNDALAERKRAILAAWPNGKVPKTQTEWETSLGHSLTSEEQKLWDAYTAADKKYQDALLASDIAEINLLDIQALIDPNAYDGNDWDVTGFGYVGQFHSRGKVNTKGKNSWADVPAPAHLKKEAVDKIDIAKALELAQYFDEDIDGKSSTGTSIVKEGEEKFTFGASYSGVQGVNITEVSGLSAAYIHGKKVLCTDGDSWTWQKGADYIFYADLDEYRYTNEVKHLRKTEIASGENRTFSTAKGADSTTKLAATIANTNVGKALLFTFNGAASAVSVSVTGLTAATTIVGANFSLNANAYSCAVTLCLTTLQSHEYAGAAVRKETTAPISATLNHTFLTYQVNDFDHVVTSGSDTAVAQKKIAAFDARTDLTKAGFTQSKTQAKDIKMALENFGQKIVNCKNVVEDTKAEVKKVEVKQSWSHSELVNTKCRIHIGKTSVTSGTLKLSL